MKRATNTRVPSELMAMPRTAGREPPVTSGAKHRSLPEVARVETVYLRRQPSPSKVTKALAPFGVMAIECGLVPGHSCRVVSAVPSLLRMVTLSLSCDTTQTSPSGATASEVGLAPTVYSPTLAFVEAFTAETVVPSGWTT